MHESHLSENFQLLKPLDARSNTIVVHASIVLYIEENLKTLLERLKNFCIESYICFQQRSGFELCTYAFVTRVGQGRGNFPTLRNFQGCDKLSLSRVHHLRTRR